MPKIAPGQSPVPSPTLSVRFLHHDPEPVGCGYPDPCAGLDKLPAGHRFQKLALHGNAPRRMEIANGLPFPPLEGFKLLARRGAKGSLPVLVEVRR